MCNFFVASEAAWEVKEGGVAGENECRDLDPVNPCPFVAPVVVHERVRSKHCHGVFHPASTCRLCELACLQYLENVDTLVFHAGSPANDELTVEITHHPVEEGSTRNPSPHVYFAV